MISEQCTVLRGVAIIYRCVPYDHAVIRTLPTVIVGAEKKGARDFLVGTNDLISVRSSSGQVPMQILTVSSDKVST